MNRTRIFCITLLLMLMLALPALAQDETSTPTEEPVATTEPTAAATEEAAATDEAIIVIIATPSGDATPVDDPPPVVVIEVPAGEQPPPVVVVVPAPEPAPPGSLIPGVSDSILLTIAIIVFMVAHMVTQGRSTALLAKYISPELALKITELQERAFQSGLEAGLAVASKTPGQEDDATWIARARANGFDAQVQYDGSYKVVKLTTTTTPPESPVQTPTVG